MMIINHRPYYHPFHAVGAFNAKKYLKRNYNSSCTFLLIMIIIITIKIMTIMIMKIIIILITIITMIMIIIVRPAGYSSSTLLHCATLCLITMRIMIRMMIIVMIMIKNNHDDDEKEEYENLLCQLCSGMGEG